MNINYIKQSYLDQLKNAIDLDLYKTNSKPWLNDHFGHDNFYNALRNKIHSDIKLNQGDSASDFENTKILHTSLRYIEPRLLAYEGLWVYFTHIYFWDYMLNRWSDERVTKDKVLQRFFISEKTDRGLLRNGIARLWFIGHMTYDENETNNPYHLTEILLSNQDILTSFAERPTLFRHKKIRIAMLMELKENKRFLVREIFRKVQMYFIYISGIKRLDSYSVDELRVMIKEKIAKLS